MEENDITQRLEDERKPYVPGDGKKERTEGHTDIVRRYLREHPDWTNMQIAEETGITPKIVSTLRGYINKQNAKTAKAQGSKDAPKVVKDDNQVSKLEKELEEAQTAAAEAMEKVTALMGERAVLATERDMLKSENEKLKDELDKARQELKRSENDLGEMFVRKAAYEAEILEQIYLRRTKG